MFWREWNVEAAAPLVPLLKSAREGLAVTPVWADGLLGKFEELEKNREEAATLTG